MRGPGQWVVIGVATTLIVIGIAAQTGTPGHRPLRGVNGQYSISSSVHLNWTSLGGSSTSSLAVSSWGPDRMDLFIRGQDAALWHRAWDGKQWTGWQSLGGALTAGPAAVSWGRDRIDVVVRGNDLGLYRIYWDGLNWSPWESLGGLATSNPALTSWGAGRLDLLVRGKDGALWHRWLPGEGVGWSSWERLDGVVSSNPAAVSWGSDRIDVFAENADGTLSQKSWDGRAWSDWAANGGQLAGSPSVASCGGGRLDVVVLRPDLHLYRLGFAGGLQHWQDLGRSVTEPAAVCRRGSRDIEVFGVAGDGSVRVATLPAS